MRIQIIGVGAVGSAIAFGILLYKRFGFLSSYSKLYITDINENKLKSELLDIRRVKEILSVRDLVIDKTKNIREVDVYIICAGHKRALLEPDQELYERNIILIGGIMKRIPVHKDTIMVTNPSKMFAEKFGTKYVGDRCDKISPGADIIKGKGFTNWGIASEVLEML